MVFSSYNPHAHIINGLLRSITRSPAVRFARRAYSKFLENSPANSHKQKHEPAANEKKSLLTGWFSSGTVIACLPSREVPNE
jgi:hypothetical protein